MLWSHPVLGCVLLFNYMWYNVSIGNNKYGTVSNPFLDVVHLDPEVVARLNEEHPRGLLVMSNHHNFHDPQLITSLARDIEIVARYDFTTLMGIPIWLAQYSGMYKKIIQYRRGDQKSGEYVKQKIVEHAKNKKAILVFPTGTSTKVDDVSIYATKLRSGVFETAAEHCIPIMCLYLNYDREIGYSRAAGDKIMNAIKIHSATRVQIRRSIYIDVPDSHTQDTIREFLRTEAMRRRDAW